MSQQAQVRTARPKAVTAARAATHIQVGAANDAYEREADRAAEEVMMGRGPAWSLSALSITPRVQRTCACGGKAGAGGECDECKEKKMLQRTARGAAAMDSAPPLVDEVLQTPGRPLDRAALDFFEPRFAHNFGGVRVHYDSRAAESARSVSASAYTVGQHIVFSEGSYRPESKAGMRLLSHELAHVVQQSGGGLAKAGPRSAARGRMSAAPRSVQRQCAAVPCPLNPIIVGSFPPTPSQAEECLQGQYAETHPNSKPGLSLGFNRGWVALKGKDLAERQALTCLKGGTTAKAGVNYTAKHGMYAAEPDIWDFANRTMYEITTAGQASFKAGDTGKLGAQISLANDLTGVPECGGLMFSPGGWVPPSPCYLLPSGLFISTVNVNGVLVYTVLKNAAQDETLLKILVLLALMTRTTGQQVGKQAVKGAGGKAVPIYAIASLVAAAVLLGSGKAEAKPGPGDQEPILQLFQALAQKGTPVPPEIKQMIEDDPELKAKLDEAFAQGADATAAQKELNDKILKIISENPDQFSKEDVEKILTMTAIAGKNLPEGDVTVAQVRQMLDKKGGSGGPGVDGNGAKKNVWERAKTPDAAPGAADAPKDPSAQPDQAADTPKSPAPPADAAKPNQWDKAKYPGLSNESVVKVEGAKGPVKDLWDAVTAGSEGPKVTDALVNQFFQVVPADLTAEQAQALIQGLGPAGGTSAEEALASIQAGIEQLQKKAHEEAVAAESAVVSIDPGSKAKKDAQQDAELIAKLAELARKGEFTGISEGEINLAWGKEEAGRISATLKLISVKKVRAAGRVTGQILHREGKKLTIRIVSSTPIVAADGTILASASAVVGQTQVFTLVSKK
jgi:hypothetical protein